MAKTFVQNGDYLNFVVPAGGLSSGQPFLLGNLFAISSNTYAAGEIGVAVLVGVHELDKAAVDITAWQPAYWDDTAKKVTNVVGSNKKIGLFIEAAAAGVAKAKVRLDGIGVT